MKSNQFYCMIFSSLTKCRFLLNFSCSINGYVILTFIACNDSNIQYHLCYLFVCCHLFQIQLPSLFADEEEVHLAHYEGISCEGTF